jgi:hypothetical protein
MTDVQPLWQGEVQFRRYSDTSTQGQQIVFAVEDREALEPFIGKEGKRFMAVLVEIGDDEQPVQQPRKDVRGPLCREACDYCAMPSFWEWLLAERGKIDSSEPEAKAWILRVCDIKSRKELDTDRQAGDDFVKLVRVPFMRWQRERKAA